MLSRYEKNKEYYKTQSLKYYYDNKDKCLDRMRSYNKLYYMKNKQQDINIYKNKKIKISYNSIIISFD